MVEFRHPNTLQREYGNDGSATIIQGRICEILDSSDGMGYIVARARAITVSGVPIKYFATKPDPNWTIDEWNRKRHHRYVFCRDYQQMKLLPRPAEPETFTIFKNRRSTRWKPVR